MRTLNRPMFNMGGPIKEGVMHGIREPYRHGRRVGYKDGGWGDYFKNIFTKATPVVKQVVGKKAKPIIAATDKIADQKWLQSLHPSRIKETISGITGSGAGQSFMRNLKDFSMTTPGWLKTAGTGIKNIYSLAPKRSLIGTTIAAPYAINLAKKIPFSKLGDVAKSYGEEWKKAFGIEDKVTDTPTDVPLNPNLQNIPEPKPTDTGSDYGQFTRAQKRIAEARATELAKKRKDDRINNLLEMMGYDQSKKDAAYNALLDASQIISQAPGGESLDISRDIIQPAIAATSKRFDKPQEIDEAVRLMMVKGEIEKDIAKDKGSQYDIKEKYLTGKLGEVAGQRSTLGKPTSVSEALLLTKATDSKKDRTSQALRNYFDGYLVPKFVGTLSEENIKKLGGKENLVEGAETVLDDGVYQVSKSYIIVEGNQITKQEDLFTAKE